MTDKTTDTNTAPSDYIMPSEALVNSLLGQTKPTIKTEAYILAEWQKLQRSQPALSRFIAANAYRHAPEDPEAREQIASSMVLTFLICSQAILQKELVSSMGESWSRYFPVQLAS